MIFSLLLWGHFLGQETVFGVPLGILLIIYLLLKSNGSSSKPSQETAQLQSERAAEYKKQAERNREKKKREWEKKQQEQELKNQEREKERREQQEEQEWIRQCCARVPRISPFQLTGKTKKAWKEIALVIGNTGLFGRRPETGANIIHLSGASGYSYQRGRVGQRRKLRKSGCFLEVIQVLRKWCDLPAAMEGSQESGHFELTIPGEVETTAVDVVFHGGKTLVMTISGPVVVFDDEAEFQEHVRGDFHAKIKSAKSLLALNEFKMALDELKSVINTKHNFAQDIAESARTLAQKAGLLSRRSASSSKTKNPPPPRRPSLINRSVTPLAEASKPRQQAQSTTIPSESDDEKETKPSFVTADGQTIFLGKNRTASQRLQQIAYSQVSYCLTCRTRHDPQQEECRICGLPLVKMPVSAFEPKDSQEAP